MQSNSTFPSACLRQSLRFFFSYCLLYPFLYFYAKSWFHWAFPHLKYLHLPTHRLLYPFYYFIILYSFPLGLSLGFSITFSPSSRLFTKFMFIVSTPASSSRWTFVSSTPPPQDVSDQLLSAFARPRPSLHFLLLLLFQGIICHSSHDYH